MTCNIFQMMQKGSGHSKRERTLSAKHQTTRDESVEMKARCGDLHQLPQPAHPCSGKDLQSLGPDKPQSCIGDLTDSKRAKAS